MAGNIFVMNNNMNMKKDNQNSRPPGNIFVTNNNMNMKKDNQNSRPLNLVRISCAL